MFQLQSTPDLHKARSLVGHVHPMQDVGLQLASFDFYKVQPPFPTKKRDPKNDTSNSDAALAVYKMPKLIACMEQYFKIPG